MASNSEDTSTRATESDVLRIVAEIRSAVQRQREEGVVTDEDIEETAAERLRAWVREIPIDAKLRGQLIGETTEWNIDIDYPIRSHRTGVLIALVLLAKRIVRPFVKLYTDHILNRQAQINLYFFALVQKAAVEQVRLERELKDVRDRLALAEGRQTAGTERD
jgi:hypothetical protein